MLNNATPIKSTVTKEIIAFLIANTVVSAWMYLFCAFFSMTWNPVNFKHWPVIFSSIGNGVFLIYSAAILYSEIRRIRRG